MTIQDLVAAPTSDSLVSALHEADLYDPSVLKAVFMVGLPAAGKSRFARAMFAGRGLKFINLDTHLERFLKQAGKNIGPGTHSLFKKAQKLAGKERDARMASRGGLLIDSTGWDYDRLAKQVHRMRVVGYDTYMVVVKTSLDVALDRNWKRGQDGGRLVPKSEVKHKYYGLKTSLPRYRKLFGQKNIVVIDNDAPVDDATFKSKVAPALTRMGDRFLARPLKNKAGRRWIATQLDWDSGGDPVVKKTADRLLGQRDEALRVALPPDPFVRPQLI